MMTTAQLSHDALNALEPPGATALVNLDHTVRLTFAEISPPRLSRHHAIDLLERSARYLEQRRAIAGIAEAVEILDISTSEQFQASAIEILETARKLTRIDPVAVLLNDSEFMEAHSRAARGAPKLDVKPLGAFDSIVRAMSSLLESCPIDTLVDLALKADTPDLGHRCRLSYDWLRAFVRRSVGTFDAADQIIGRAFAQGRLSRDEASSLLSLPLQDAVAWLEQQGYARDLDVIVLEDHLRADRLAAIRNERVRRGGVPANDPSLVARDVLASQRIEDVDARPWVRMP